MSNTFNQAISSPQVANATLQWFPTQSKHIHVDLALIDWKDITIIKGNQKIIVTPEELAIKLGLEW